MSAALVNKFMGLLGIKENDIDEDEEIDETVDYNYENEEEDKLENAYKSYKARRSSFSSADDEYVNNKSQGKVIPMTGTVTTNSKMVITQPTCFDDVVDVCDYIKARKSVIVNLETVNSEEGRRILDFLSGSTYAIEGNMQKISKLIYLITPKNIEIQNDVERETYRSKLGFSWLK